MNQELHDTIRAAITLPLITTTDATPVGELRKAAAGTTLDVMAVTAAHMRGLPTQSIDGTPTPYVKLEDVLFALGQRP